jgi:alpha-L-fucosidase
MITKRIALLLLASFSLTTMSAAPKVEAPKPILPLPEQKQIDWQKMETYAFIHFGLNTFNDREWGYGDTDPQTFNPTKLDCEQWARTLVAAGMKGVILTAKHHDGFCLWPFAGNDYNVSKSPFREGKGNIVRELSEACKKYGLKFAVYLSPWDRSRADYATPSYLPYFYAQLRDLLTNYGEVFEVWFDGANGGDGYYGGAKDTRTIDRKNYYNYPRIFEMLDSLQPQAVVFGDGGPGCRWVGNEKGFAGETNWSFLRKGEVYPGYPRYKELQYGHADGNQWTAAECDVSIRPGWFYHPEEDDKVKSPEQLVDLYYRSVGHNATLLLNFPVDRDGLIHPVDSANAVAFRNIIQRELGTNLVARKKAKVSSERGKEFSAKALTDDNWDSYWATPDGVSTGTVEFTFKKAQPMNRIMLQEYIPLGQRVKQFVVEYLDDEGSWKPVKQNEETTTIGYKRLLRFKTVTSKGIRVRITDARGPLCINNIGVYYGGENAQLTWSAATEKIGNSLDFNILERGNNGKLHSWNAEKLSSITDRDVTTTAFANADEIVIDFGKEVNVSQLQYLPQQSDDRKGLVATYTIATCDAEGNTIRTIKTGEFSNIQNNPVLQTTDFVNVKTRFLKFKAEKTTTPGESMGIAELSIH